MEAFIACDFSMPGGLPDIINAVANNPPADCSIRWPGSPGGESMGAIWSDIVRPGIDQCDRLVAYVDRPNANVGFEFGYALGMGKSVALARVLPELPEWLNRPPLNGLVCSRAKTPNNLRLLLVRDDTKWAHVHRKPECGIGVLFLCPPDCGSAYCELKPEEWKTLEPEGWGLAELPAKLQGIDRVIWVITSHYEGGEERDGDENAAMAVVAGYAEACDDIDLAVFIHKDARSVADVVARKTTFSDGKDLARRLRLVVEPREKTLMGTEQPKPIPPERPTRIPPLPTVDWEDIEQRFVGRERQLADLGDAFKGLLQRFRGDETPTGGAAVQLLWMFGFGGMGKSWFLHKAIMDAAAFDASIQTALIDWDANKWGEPLPGVPLIPEDLCEPIALRLAQLYGTEQVDEYWKARSRVHKASEIHRRLHDEFVQALRGLGGGGALDPMQHLQVPDPDLRRLLADQGIWSDDPTRRDRNIEHLLGDPCRRQPFFETWCRKCTKMAHGQDEAAAIRPDYILIEGLQSAIRHVARQRPLVILLDTCESLNWEMDRWLRKLLAGLCDGQMPVLTLIGSRLAPDVALRRGTREGWREEISERLFRTVAFDRHMSLTVNDVAEALRRLDPPAPQSEGLAETLHRVTRGVPLALHGLLSLHERGVDVLEDTMSLERSGDDLEESEAVRRVIELVSNRMLLHLQRGPETEQDLRDIVALALLVSADREVLDRFWDTSNSRSRLRELSRRYSLVSGGDLHEEVRGFLRRNWRRNEPPGCFDDVLTRLEEIEASLPKLGQPGDKQALARSCLRLNLVAWRRGEEALDEFAQALALALAYDQHVREILGLAIEVVPRSEEARRTRELLKRFAESQEWTSWQWDSGWGSSSQGVIAWIDRMRARSRHRPPLETAAAHLLKGLAYHWRSEPEVLREAFGDLEQARAGFEGMELPRKDNVRMAYARIGNALYKAQSWPDKRGADVIEKAYRRALGLGFEPGSEKCAVWFNLALVYLRLEREEDALRASQEAIAADPKDAQPYYLYGLAHYRLSHYEDAEQAYRKSIKLKAGYAYPHCGLGDILQYHHKQYKESEQEYRKAIELDPERAYAWNGLGDLLQYDLKRYDESEQAYRKAIELDPKYASPWNGLGNLLQNPFKRYDESEQAYRKAMELNPDEPRYLNNLADLYLVSGGDLDEALRLAESACQSELHNAYYLHTLVAIRVRRGEIKEAEERFPTWLDLCDEAYITKTRPDIVALFRDLIQQGRLEALAGLLRERGGRSPWRPWWEALSPMVEGREPANAGLNEDAMAVYRDLSEAR